VDDPLEDSRSLGPGPVEVGLSQLVEQLRARVEEGSLELERTHSEYEIAHAELEAVNAELQKLLLEQERLQAELAYRALHDPLTGLANRSMFGERLDQAFKVAGRGVAVLWIDLDDFKEVNDIFGHEVGDELLLAIADRLREIVRETDDIARMGGDEFAIVVPNVGRDESELVGQRVLDALLDQDSFRLQIRASVGVSWQNSSVGDRKVLLRRADEAMYKAKAAGGGLMVVWCP
jgi:diguanylate cyclase (GGDEF)-like protein